MKKISTLALFVFCSVLHAQMLTVSGTVTDSDGTAWANGFYTITFYPNPSYPNFNQYYINGVPLSNFYTTALTGSLDGSAHFSQGSIPNNNLIQPTGSKYAFNFCPNASAPCGNFISAVTSSGDISALITANIPPPRFNGLAGAFGYADIEARVTIPAGATYWNVNNACQRYFNNVSTSWACSANTVTCGTQNLPCLNTGNVFSNGTQAIKAVAAQSYDFFQIQNTSGTPIAGVNSFGQFYTSSTAGLPANSPALGSISFDTTNNRLDFFGNTGWQPIATTVASTTVNGLSGAVLLASLSSPHFTVNTPVGQTINLQETNHAYTDVANTFTTGPQTVQTGTPGTVGVIVKGTAILSNPLVVHSQSEQGSSSITLGFTPVLGNNLIVLCRSNDPFNTDSVGNTYTRIAGINSSNNTNIYATLVAHTGAGIVIGPTSFSCGNLISVYELHAVQQPIASAIDFSSFTNNVGATTWTTPTFNITAQDLVMIGNVCTSGSFTSLPVASGFTQDTNGTSGVTWNMLTQAVNASVGVSYTSTWGTCIQASPYVFVLKGGVGTQQTGDLTQFEQYDSTLLSRVDAIGAFNPPQSAGSPTQTPTAGTHVYDTTNHCDKMYDALSGWVCMAQAVTTTSRTAGTNGFYAIAADGTITEWVTAGNNATCTVPTAGSPCLNNNTVTSITLPHSIPTTVMSIVCVDNGPRVQAGNDQAVGANVIGLSAPYTTFNINAPATGMTAYCIVVGF